MSDRASWSRRVARFERVRILVLGDVILDRYVWGSVERISPEAPVPVVRVTRESVMLGGAGNVARNLVSLGGQVRFAAVVGDDETGAEIARLLADWKIDAAGLTADAARPTTVKTRVIARAQQVVRFDRESDDPIGPDAARRLVAAARAALPHVDGVILEDYGKGVLTAPVVEELVRLFASAGRPVFVDPKADHWTLYRDVELLKPNLREAASVTGIRVRAPEDVERVGRALLELSGARTLAITQGEQGMTLFHRDGRSEHIPTRARAVAEASGAGDTAIAALALARLAGADWVESAKIANAAAGVVVGVPGTSTVSQAELLEALADAEAP
jgi:D-beta-D-heptose 7-phosphate kinase/D-beta-D-heptose 1-phosphate adenosyltransferase